METFSFEDEEDHENAIWLKVLFSRILKKIDLSLRRLWRSTTIFYGRQQIFLSLMNLVRVLNNLIPEKFTCISQTGRVFISVI